MQQPFMLVSAILLHIPDGFLATAVSLICWVVALIFLSFALRRAQATFSERLVPLAGVMAAFIFAAQMINFPVAGGTSGHLIGATLAFIVLGPWLGVVVMTAVIILQALLFQDGGLLVMGANILVMGIVPGFVGYGFYRLAANRGATVRLIAAGSGAWLSIVAAALVTAVLLAASGTANIVFVLPVMVGVHMLIGVGEALITVAALAFLARVRPELIQPGRSGNGLAWLLSGLAIVVAIILLAPYASSAPDGLEWVAQQQGFAVAALPAPYELLADYSVPLLGGGPSSTVISGLVGALLVALIVVIASRTLSRRKPQEPRSS